mmetsp:Transcript_70522/g.181757  ORF Transcript_70522/g.181757 Transcript_70522/m.181757 type:complete len:267 (-) Transcript_70522:639-1439(-)
MTITSLTFLRGMVMCLRSPTRSTGHGATWSPVRKVNAGHAFRSLFGAAVTRRQTTRQEWERTHLVESKRLATFRTCSTTTPKVTAETLRLGSPEVQKVGAAGVGMSQDGLVTRVAAKCVSILMVMAVPVTVKRLLGAPEARIEIPMQAPLQGTDSRSGGAQLGHQTSLLSQVRLPAMARGCAESLDGSPAIPAGSPAHVAGSRASVSGSLKSVGGSPVNVAGSLVAWVESADRVPAALLAPRAICGRPLKAHRAAAEVRPGTQQQR